MPESALRVTFVPGDDLLRGTTRPGHLESELASFRDENDLRRSIHVAGLDEIADRIVATARPAIRFQRRQVSDDPLPNGVSKHGGLPDLPPDFAWPRRLARPDADRWERSIRDRRVQLDAFLSQLSSRARDAEQAGRFETAFAPNAEEDAKRDRHEELLIASFHRDFPLAFRAQFDLAALAVEPGFDADLPRHGVLSIFEDMTGDGSGDDLRVFWHDQPAASLARRPVPAELAALSDTHIYAQPWTTLDKAELLVPHSALSLPHHWTKAGPHRDAMFELIRRPAHEFVIHAEEQEENVADFGDQLGGWPNPIQLDPEAEFLGDARMHLPPGDDRVRQIFAWAGEYYEGTRLPYTDAGGDGTTHVLIHRDALLRRDFSGARSIYQCD